ncbi:MAG: anti-sigma factor family protein [Anaerolineae bacterium]
MPEEKTTPVYGKRRNASHPMHSDRWWAHLLADDLTAEERADWEAHLRSCRRCQEMWQRFRHVDDVLRQAPAPPELSVGFTARTVHKIAQRQRLRRLLSFLAGILIVTLVSLVVFSYLGAAYASLERGFSAVISARQVLFRSLVRTFVGLLLSWRAIMPYLVGLALVTYLLVMPNGALVTIGLLWLSRRRRASTTG